MRNQIISFLFIACLFISACSNDDDRDVRKVTDYKEYTLTVASKKLPGGKGNRRTYPKRKSY